MVDKTLDENERSCFQELEVQVGRNGVSQRDKSKTGEACHI